MVMSGENAGNEPVGGPGSRPGGGPGNVPGGGSARGSGPVRQRPSAPLGLRERKKQLTYQAVSDAAIAMFLERGFDKVSVAEVAAAADISKPTLFRYFPAKEDLVLHRFADHEDEAARVVAGRPSGDSPLDALRRHFLDGLDRRDPVTGLCDVPEVLAFLRLLYGTPSLVARMYAYQGRSEAALARALGGGVSERLAAGQIVAVLRILALDNWRRIDAGESADRVYAGAVQAAEDAFVQLRTGLEPRPRG
ncbi:TetR/AcrR family transcriptional regulator [Streptomyces griseus]|uniref:TetR family transcriptional regulator n=1 Tax=Streptomyces griseus TaxID=1911 RepID=UPI00386D8CD8|nr:TetR/AcrR family transcriptional regulator [Streptomyces griseus]WTD68455.1 TetR/AcrR family transcriptional regulator [Streptomyces griseus]